MSKKGGGLCLNRIRAHVRVRSPTIQCSSQEPSSSTKTHRKTENPTDEQEEKKNINAGDPKTGLIGTTKLGRRIMVVVDSSSEAKNALLWTLSHSVLDHDTIVLLHFLRVKRYKSAANEESCKKQRTSRAYESLSPLKNICQLKRPEVNVEGLVVEGEEKGPAIVREARAQGVGLLVMGQKKQSITWRLVLMWAGQAQVRPTNRNDVVGYCINHSPCVAIAVRKKSKKLGGYTLTTKRHRDFWLLA